MRAEGVFLPTLPDPKVFDTLGNSRSAALLIIRGRFFRIRMICQAFAFIRKRMIASAPQPSAASVPTPPSMVEAHVE
jgi:hypothetical protein